MQKRNSLAKRFSALLLALFSLVILTPETVSAAPTIRVNAKGSSVTQLQQKLIELSYNVDKATGIFEAKTHYAVKQFQKDHQLTPNGVVDNKTWKAIDQAIWDKKRGNSPGSPAPIAPSGKKPAKIEGLRKNAPAIIQTARQYIGVPYQFGGATPKGFDCSGYLQYVFAKHSINLPRLADAQYKLGSSVNKTALMAGDLVFFTTYEPGASHCGLYIGNGEFIHASSSKGIRIDKLSDPYWSPRYLGARCILK